MQTEKKQAFFFLMWTMQRDEEGEKLNNKKIQLVKGMRSLFQKKCAAIKEGK